LGHSVREALIKIVITSLSYVIKIVIRSGYGKIQALLIATHRVTTNYDLDVTVTALESDSTAREHDRHTSKIAL
jgi:hypothetical protein